MNAARRSACETSRRIGPERAKRERYERSILDAVLEDADSLHHKLGIKDRRKLDEYLTAVREIERHINRAELDTGREAPPYAQPSGVPKSYAEHVRLMGDLMVLAFQADLTRVVTFVFANEGSNRHYDAIDIHEGHHELSHHGHDPVKQEKIRTINRFHVTQLAYILRKNAVHHRGRADAAR